MFDLFIICSANDPLFLRMLKAYFDVLQAYQAFGNCFASLSVREPQPRASEAFRLFGETHRNLERDGVKMLKAIKPVSLSRSFITFFVIFNFV